MKIKEEIEAKSREETGLKITSWKLFLNSFLYSNFLYRFVCVSPSFYILSFGFIAENRK